ncbi:MAG TPA: GNAT family N-acetyltransferase [Pseudonocardiaceae bacterium]|nr:GNAT family N-acetyltransferase [Pseudonocardiaceae bacterium]
MTIELPGQDALLGSWAALAGTSPGARLERTGAAVGSVFPAWAALNNVIVLGEPDTAAAELGVPGTTDGLAAWALVWHGVAVSSAWTYRHGTDCGIYGFSTVPAWRRRGLAAALMRHLLSVAAADGAVTATLRSTPMGRPLYESLGFVTVGRYEEWVPDDAAIQRFVTVGGAAE